MLFLTLHYCYRHHWHITGSAAGTVAVCSVSTLTVLCAVFVTEDRR